MKILRVWFAMVALLSMPGAAWAADGYTWQEGVFSVPLTIKDNSGVARHGWPVSTGVPFPVGAVRETSALRLTDAQGRELPAQFTVLSRHGARGGSLRWVLVDFQVDLAAGAAATVTLRNDRPAAPVADPVRLTRERGRIRVTTGAFEAVVPTTTGALLESVAVGGRELLAAQAGDGPALRSGAVTLAERNRGVAWNTHGWEKQRTLEAVNLAEAVYSGGRQPPDLVQVESEGPLRATLLIKGRYLPEERGGGVLERGMYRYTTRLHLYRGHSFVTVEHAVENSSREQPQWSHLFHEASLSHALTFGPEVVLSGGGHDPAGAAPAVASMVAAAGTQAWLYQEAGDTIKVGGRTRGETGGYRFGAGSAGLIGAPLAAGGRGRYVHVSDGTHGFGVAMRYLWQEAPRAIALSGGRVTTLLHADAPGRVGSRPQYQLDFAERNLHDVLYYFHAGDLRAGRMADIAEAFEYPLFALAPLAWYADSGAWYFEISREKADGPKGADSDAHWAPDRVGVRGHGNRGGSYNSGGHHESLNSSWLSYLRSGALADLERRLIAARWDIAHNAGWAYVDNVLPSPVEGGGRFGELDRALMDWDRLTGYGPKDFYLWRSDQTWVEETPRGPKLRHHGPRSYLNGYKVLPDHEHYALFNLFEYYYLTGDRRALDSIHGFVNWAVNFQHKHLFRRRTLPLSVTDLFTRDPQALYRGHYSRVYSWMLYTTMAGYHATGSPVFDHYARWQLRRLLALLRDRHGQLTSARDATKVLGDPGDPARSVLESRAQPWMEAQGVMALHEAYKTYDDERILDGLWAQADYFSHHVLMFPTTGMLNNRTAMPNLLLGTGEGRGRSLQPHRHDGYVQMWPVLYHYTGWPAVRERYDVFEAARQGTYVRDVFLQTGDWERQTVPKRAARAPEPIADLRVVRADRAGIVLEWTSPRAFGAGARAQRYFVKYSDKPIVEFAPMDHPDRLADRARVVREVEALALADPKKRLRGKNLRVDSTEIMPEPEGTQRWHPDWHRVDAFWMAEHVAGEPRPVAAGQAERFTIRTLRPHSWLGVDKDPGLEILAPGTYYVAIASWDEDRNLSRPSNVVSFTLR